MQSMIENLPAPSSKCF